MCVCVCVYVCDVYMYMHICSIQYRMREDREMKKQHKEKVDHVYAVQDTPACIVWSDSNMLAALVYSADLRTGPMQMYIIKTVA